MRKWIASAVLVVCGVTGVGCAYVPTCDVGVGCTRTIPTGEELTPITTTTTP